MIKFLKGDQIQLYLVIYRVLSFIYLYKFNKFQVTGYQAEWLLMMALEQIVKTNYKDFSYISSM